MERKWKTYFVVFIVLVILIIMPIRYNLSDFESFSSETNENVQSSAERIVTKQWIKNPTFESPIQPIWYWEEGTEGDNSDMDATTSPGQANHAILGEEQTFSILSGNANSSTWSGWGIYNNGDYLLPDRTEINATGCYVYHYLDEGESGGSGQVHNFPSVHFKKNATLAIDISDYEITSSSLEVFFNASVDSNVDAPGDVVGQSAIWDSATFYVEISDLNNSYAFRIAEYKTQTLGQDFPSNLTISDQELSYVNENDLITALNLALQKDVSHSRFTIIMGLDIYCEDNDFPDYDLWRALIFKSFNLSFTYEKKIDQFTSLSWNQICNTITGGNIQIKDANFNFKYKIDNIWPTSAPLSELNFYINDRKFEAGSIKISSATTSFQEANPGGFNVTSFILKDINITVSIETFIKDTFNLNETITISIDDVFLNITYVETFPDYATELTLILNGIDKTLDPIVQLPIDVILNITVRYRDNLTKAHISNALVQLDGKVSGPLPENITYQQYSIFVNSSQLGIGSRILSVQAQKSNYVSQSTQILVEVYERGTNLSLYVNNQPRVESEIIQIEMDETLNISVFFEDLITENHLSGATIELLGFGFLGENVDHYNITINSSSLNLGTNILTIFAQLDNYQTQTFKFFINLIQRSTQLEVLLNGDDRTPDPAIDVYIGQMINVSIRYKDNSTGSHISGGTLQLIGEGLSLFLQENSTLNQYYVILNSTELQLGSKSFSVVAQATDYNINTVNIIINVNRIRTNIGTYSGETNFYLEPNESFTLMIYLNNTVYGGLIKNATVTYRWALGQGELMDLDNDGIYEVYFQNIPGGTHIMKITAYAGKNYEFEEFEIIISVSIPPAIDWKWLVIILGSSTLGLIIVIVSYLKYFKFSPLVRKIRKLKRKVVKNKKLHSIILQNRASIIEANFKEKIGVIETEKGKIVEDVKSNQNDIIKGGTV